MNAKQVGLLVAILALCVGGVLLVNSKKAKTVQAPSGKIGDQPFADLAINDATAVTIRDKEGSVELAKGEDGWEVANRGGYPADFTELTNFLRSLPELKVAEAVPLGGAPLERLELAAPGAEPDPEAEGTGTVVTVAGEGGSEMASFTLGKEYEGAQTAGPFGNFANSTGRFLKKGNDVVIVSDTVMGARASAADWLDKDFFKVQQLKSIAFDAEDDADSWLLTREEALGDFTLAGAAEGEELDTAKVGAFKNAFSAPSFKDVVPDPDDATTGLDSPQTFTVETFEGFRYVIDVGDATEDGDFYLTVATEAEFPTEYVPEPDDADAAEDAAGDPADAELTDEERAQKAEEEKQRKEDEAKRKEEEFKAEVERKQEKLEQEKSFAGVVYLVNKWSVDSVLKTRGDLLRPVEEPAAPGPGDATAPPPVGLTPTADGSQPRITAVTPPIAVPPPVEPAEDGEDGEDGEEEGSEEEENGEAPEGEGDSEGAEE